MAINCVFLLSKNVMFKDECFYWLSILHIMTNTVALFFQAGSSGSLSSTATEMSGLQETIDSQKERLEQKDKEIEALVFKQIILYVIII